MNLCDACGNRLVWLDDDEDGDGSRRMPFCPKCHVRDPRLTRILRLLDRLAVPNLGEGEG